MTRIAVLGGGASSLFAVWDLVKTDPRAYDITVYQMGWRLGGKGASGRRVEHGKTPRIEEHGLHFMFGFYENVFRVVREAYAKAYEGEGPDYWKRFFKTVDTEVAVIHFVDKAQTQWEAWTIPYPEVAFTNATLPGDEGSDGDPSIGLILRNMWAWIEGCIRELGDQRKDIEISYKPPSHPPSHLSALLHRHHIREQIDTLDLPPSFSPSGTISTKRRHHAIIPAYWDFAHKLLAATPQAPDSLDPDRHDKLVGEAFQTLDDLAKTSPQTRDHWLKHGLREIAHLVFTCIRGVFKDLFLKRKRWFDLDGDFRAWVRDHGGDPDTPIITGLYDAVFATYSELATGAILQAFTKAAFLGKGGAIYKMQAGMGDTIFTPLFLALKSAGVKFEFFHRVENLGLSPDKKHIETIVFERQVTPKEAAYDPLLQLDVDVGGHGMTRLGCWPSEPLWDRIRSEDVARVKAEGIDLESRWTEAVPDRVKTLTLGTDFDIVVLGISVAALPDICAELMEADPAFREHVNALAPATCATQAMQVWTRPGYTPQQPRPVVVPYAEPYDTVTDMRQLLSVEQWPAGLVDGLIYLCSAIDEKSKPPPPRSQTLYPSELRKRATDDGRSWLANRAPILWRNLATRSGLFDWNALYDPDQRVGSDRFAAQWVSTPTNLSDRYVIPVPGSHKWRLKSNETRFANLYITGDWIKTSLSIGCLEAAAMSGLQAARAISLELGVGATPSVPRAHGDWIEDVTPRTRLRPAEQRSTMIRFRQRDGDRFAEPPFDVKMDDVFLLVLGADGKKLQAVCDNDLNDIGPDRYTPLGNFLILYGSTLENVSQGTTTKASEIGFWIPVATERGHVMQLYTYTPYVWLDSGTSTRVGRALYGYPKQTGEVFVPGPGDDLGLEVKGDALVQTGPSTHDILQRSILRAGPRDARAWTRPPTGGIARWTDFARLMTQITHQLVTLPTVRPRDLVPLVQGMRSIFLRQLPGVGSFDPPAYQALIEAAIVPKVRSLFGACLDVGELPWEVLIPRYRQPQIVDTLGLLGTSSSDRKSFVATTLAVAWMKFEGTLEAGTEICRAGR